MHRIYDKLNNHEYLNSRDLKNFISIYSKNTVNTEFTYKDDVSAFYNNVLNTIFIYKYFKKMNLNHLNKFSQKKINFLKDEEPNFLVDLYNLDTICSLLHELKHADQFKKIKHAREGKSVSSKTKLMIENYEFMRLMPKLYEKNHDLYYFEYDSIISSLIQTLNIISKCKNLNKNSIIEYNRLMSCIIYHAYGNKYINDDVSKMYNKFSSPISYSIFLSNIVSDKNIKKDIIYCIKDIINNSQTEYLKFLNGCELSYDTIILLWNIARSNHDTTNLLNSIKELQKEKNEIKVKRL